jgi:gliding motility-associated protein GldL
MDSVPGQTFLNYAYSWGAAIVILGTLFKLTYLKYADIMLFIGMGTEVFVFFISAFDRPFDKTTDGMEMPTHVTEEFLETGKVEYSEKYEGKKPAVQQAAPATQQPVSAPQGGTIVIGAPVAQNAEQATELTEAQSQYVEELKSLTETLKKVSKQSERLSVDSEEMENLNRTLTGICKVYEMQLKSASKQIGTIDEINEQTAKMANQITELNKIYQRMIEAMTVNMRAANPGINPIQ